MARIPFALFPFPDPNLSAEAIERRLHRHLAKLIAERSDREAPMAADGSVSRPGYEALLDSMDVPYAKARRLRRRAERIAERHAAKSPVPRMRPEDRKRMELLRHGVEVVALPSEHRADELAAALHAEFPWMGRATEAVWLAMRRSVQRGDVGLRLPPMLLDGPPGIGKSHWARHLGTLIGVPHMAYDATNENASFGLVGSQKGWSNATPGRLMTLILTERVANPVVVVDEVEKAGTARSSGNQSFDLAAALLPLLEPLSARHWTCPYHEAPFDMGWVIWVLTSNDWRRLPEPLLSRCPPIRLADLSLADLVAFARREGDRRGLSEPSVEAIAIAITRSCSSGQRISLRTVMRLLDRAVSLETTAVLN